MNPVGGYLTLDPAHVAIEKVECLGGEHDGKDVLMLSIPRKNRPPFRWIVTREVAEAIANRLLDFE